VIYRFQTLEPVIQEVSKVAYDLQYNAFIIKLEKFMPRTTFQLPNRLTCCCSSLIVMMIRDVLVMHIHGCRDTNSLLILPVGKGVVRMD
jgi:hypothetical protein